MMGKYSLYIKLDHFVISSSEFLRLMRRLVTISLLYLLSACGDNPCVTTDPVADPGLPGKPILLTNVTTVTAATATTQAGQATNNSIWSAGFDVTNTGTTSVVTAPVLVKVSGVINGCPPGTTNSDAPDYCNPIHYPGVVFEYPKGMCSQYGTYWSVAANNPGWVSTVSILPGASVTLTIPPFYKGTLTPPNQLGCASVPGVALVYVESTVPTFPAEDFCKASVEKSNLYEYYYHSWSGEHESDQGTYPIYCIGNPYDDNPSFDGSCTSDNILNQCQTRAGNYTIACSVQCSAFGTTAPLLDAIPNGCTDGLACNCTSSTNCAQYPYYDPTGNAANYYGNVDYAQYNPNANPGESFGNCTDLTFGNYWSPYGIFYSPKPSTNNTDVASRMAGICNTIVWGDTPSTYYDSVTSFTQAYDAEGDQNGWWLGGGIGLKMKLCDGQCDLVTTDECNDPTSGVSCTNNTCQGGGGTCTSTSCSSCYNPGDFFVSGPGNTSDGAGYIGGVTFSQGPDHDTASICGTASIVARKRGELTSLQFDPTRFTTQTISNSSKTTMYLNLRIQDGDYPTPGGTGTANGYPASGPGDRPYTSYGDNIGGYNVYVSNTNPNYCPATNGQPVLGQDYGELLTQTIDLAAHPAPSLAPPANSMFIGGSLITRCTDIQNSLLQSSCNQNDITEETAAYYYIANPTPGTMYFTINPRSDGQPMTGMLNVTTYSVGTAGAFSSYIMTVLGLVKSTLTAATSTIFSNMTGNIDYVSYIRVLLQLYIVLYGVMFLMGTVKISQFDLIIRVIKIAVVVGLTSPNSWNFFSSTLFDLYIKGGSVLIKVFTSSTLAGSSSTGDTVTASNPFSFVDRMFNILFFGSGVWLRVLALMLSNALGFLFAALIIWGAVCYFFAILEAVVEYVLAIFTVQILLVLAPIFIPFVLFGATKHLFESWLKFLFSFAIKPVILLIGLCILSNMLIVVTLEILSFNVCYNCYLSLNFNKIMTAIAGLGSFNFGDNFFCIRLPSPWGVSQSGDGVTFLESTGLEIAKILLFVLITKFMAKLPNFVDQMTSRLSGNRGIILKTEGGPGGQSQTVAQRFMGSAKDSLLSTIGMDKGSRQRRKDAARKRGVDAPKDDPGVNVAKGPQG